MAGALRILTADLTVTQMLAFLLWVVLVLHPVRRFDNFIRVCRGTTGLKPAMN